MSSFTLAVFNLAARMLTPALPLMLGWRARRGKEDPARLGERLGRPGLPRPEGHLVWLHGVSVGESGVARMLAIALAEKRSGLNFLVTSATRTSAVLWGTFCAGDPRFRHQYAPLDSPDYAARFLDHWRPDLGILIESEIWPNLLQESARKGICLALVNARMGAGSRRFWQRVPRTSRAVFGAFSFIGAADRASADFLAQFATRAPVLTGNLKAAGPVSGGDALWHDRLSTRWADRFVWIGVSTHESEEEILLAAHRRLCAQRPGSVLVLAPRHPERADKVARAMEEAGFEPRRWSAMRGEPFSGGPLPVENAPRTPEVLLADRLGDMGLWLGLASAAFVGGSLRADYQGHNPMEAAALGVPILAGPHVTSFAPLYARLQEAEAMIPVDDYGAIAHALDRIAGDRDFAHGLAMSARAVRAEAAAGLEGTVAALLALLDQE